MHAGDFPGGPEIRAPRFHVSGLRFNPWLGKQDSACHVVAVVISVVSDSV